MIYLRKENPLVIVFRHDLKSLLDVPGRPYPTWASAIAAHQAKLGRVPRLVATDAGFYSARNSAAKAMGVKCVCIPNRSSKSPERKREQKKRWFRTGQKWRTGCEGRIRVVKPRNGLDRCRYKGDDGMARCDLR
jgi:IS5 family transposase